MSKNIKMIVDAYNSHLPEVIGFAFMLFNGWQRLRQLWFLSLVFVFMLPVLALFAAWIPWGDSGAVAAQIWGEMGRTVLPDYVWTTLRLCAMVAFGVVVVGLSSAAAVTLFDFPGRRFFEWALLLPLAMPAYVVAYAYTDFLQFSGPLQTALRSILGVEGRVLPEIRGLGGAAWVFIFALYPYVYLLARTALGERAAHLMEAARLLGAPMRRRMTEVALPLARPAVAAGAALALMETLADFGVSSYFGIQTFTAGIYKAWLSMDNRIAAAQLATMLLMLVALLLFLEQRAQKRMRFSSTKVARAGYLDSQPLALSGRFKWLAWIVCALPVLMGFVLPVLFMLRPLVADWEVLSWSRFLGWALNSLRLGALSATLALGLALLLAFNLRRRADAPTRLAVQCVSLGYAVPGAVIVVGLLLPVGWLQAFAPESSVGYWVTATSLGLVWAYLVRFTAVALQSVQSGYARIPVSFDESARLLGTGDWALMQRVHWPLLRRSTAAAALLVFVDVMKELPATLVLRPFNSDTLAVVAYQLARDERLGEAALPSLALVLVGLIPVVLLSRTLRAPSS
jgi:iron(III) transport system permease protein